MKLAEDPPCGVVDCPKTRQLHVIVERQHLPIQMLTRVRKVRHLGRVWDVFFLDSVNGSELLENRLGGSARVEEGLHEHTLLIFGLCESGAGQEEKFVFTVKHGDDFAYEFDGGVELCLLGENVHV